MSFLSDLLPPPASLPDRGGARFFRTPLSPRFYDRAAQASSLDVDTVHAAVTQARDGNMTPLLSLYRQIEMADDVIQSALNSRKLAVLAEPLRVVPYNENDADDVAQARAFAAAVDASPSFWEAQKHLLSSCVWPVAVAQLRWLPGAVAYSAFELRPVPLEQLDYRTGRLRVAQVEPGGFASSTSEYPDPSRFVIHRGHLCNHPDTFGGPFRALLFWHLFGACTRDWWARFLERFGTPFPVGKYDPDDDESRAALELAFSEAARSFGLVVTTDTQIEFHEARSSVGADAFERFLDIATAAKTRLILGQTLSAKTDATGLGSGVAALQGQVRSDYARYDRAALAQTLRAALAEPFSRYNRLPGRPPQFV